jgi:fumarate hydratase class II
MPEPTTTVPMRLESDRMGTVAVPANVYWGAQTAYADGTSRREACVKLGCLTEEEFDAIMRPEEMTHP